MEEIISEEKVNTVTIKNLLQNVAVIQKKYGDIAEITGENFNIFSILKMDSKEVRTHSAFIGELLNPKGSHGLKGKPLEIFVELLKSKFSEKNSNGINNKFILKTDTVTTTVEKYIGFTNEDKTEGGRIDILIEDKNKNAIIIENKIYAIEQTNQLIRYNNYSKDAPILYLTLYGDAPTSHGELKENIHYFNISYEKDIKEWLELCLKEAVEFPMLREVIKQYIYLIKKLTNQSTNNRMNNEIKKLIEKDFDTVKIVVEVFNNYMNDAKIKLGAIYHALDFDDFKDEGVEILLPPPAKSGQYSDCFGINIKVGQYSITYNVDIEDNNFSSYYYDKIQILEDNKIDPLPHDGNKKPNEIATEITKRVSTIISLLKEAMKKQKNYAVLQNTPSEN